MKLPYIYLLDKFTRASNEDVDNQKSRMKKSGLYAQLRAKIFRPID